jgi:predicted nucleotide-binding protein
MNKDSDYTEWRDNLSTFLDSIPEEYCLKALTKGVDYGKTVYKYHKDSECTNITNCPLNQSWERRLAIAKDLLKKFQPAEEHQILNIKPSFITTRFNSGFIIHGHDHTRKLEVARFLENDLKYKAIILHEQPNKGRTIIEKFENSSNVDFAIALWTADDVGNTKTNTNLNKRARQNVVFETGFFIGKIGRENVIVLYEQGVEIPSDYSGVIFIPFDNNWKDDLRREITAIYSNNS